MKAERPQIQSFSVTTPKKHVIAWIDEMAQRERKSKSEVIIRCIEYYYRKKWPGNPIAPLFPSLKPNFVDPEKLREARFRQAMVFLRLKVTSLSYRQIGLIVGRSREFVRRFIKGLDPELHPGINRDNRRQLHKKPTADTFKKTLPIYRRRLHEWLDGKHDSLEEAFGF